jgi:O-antigen/teichoic acid export membrane protein
MTPRSLTRNASWNLVGLSLPLLVGVAVLPLIVSHLGTERFGILGLLWAVLNYVALFDLGLGRAATTLLAARLSKSDLEAASEIVGFTLLAQAGLGVLAGVVLAVLAPVLVERVFQVSPALQEESRAAAYWLAVALPFILVTLGSRGMLEAAQRFDLVNLVRVPGGAADYALPAVAALAGGGLESMAVVLMLGRVGTCALSLHALRRAIPEIGWHWPRAGGPARQLLAFGGWVTVSNVVSPMLAYGDRLILGALAGAVAVGYYTAPFEAIMRVQIVPVSIAAALLPAVSAAHGGPDPAQIRGLYLRSVGLVGGLLVLPILVVVIWSGDLLGAWLGPVFAAQGAVALRILAVGMLINSLANIPYFTLQGLGRPDLAAKFHLLELPLYAAAAVLLVGRYGLPGAALAWSGRVTLDAVLLFWAAGRVQRRLGGSERKLTPA